MFKPSKRSGGPGAMRAQGFGSLCTLILCGYALVQAQPPAESKTDPKPEAQTPTKPEPRSEADTATKAGLNARPKSKRSTTTLPKTGTMDKPRRTGARRPPARPGRGASSFRMDPNAKFVCENPIVTLDPVWPDSKNLTFPFIIRNDGTADLRIKARGG